MKRVTILLALLAGAGPAIAADNDPFRFDFEEISAGVWVGVRPDSPRYPVMGNATFVISSEGVVVFDGGGMPAMAEQLINKIRSITDVPVTHVVTSHWHGDHNFGIFRFAEEFPGVQFIAHEFTRYVMNSTRIAYIDRSRNFIKNNLDEFQKIVSTGFDSDGKEISAADVASYRRIINDADVIDFEFNRAKVTPPNVVFTDSYTIESGDRIIELRHLGHANTAGDIVMWLPDERIVATGDIVVLPSPYAFNVPPRKWAETLRALNELEYSILVPGHGDIQNDTAYVDLIIEAAESIADQRDVLLADGMSNEDVQAALDFSAFEERFTHGDAYIKDYYDAYFERPFRAAAMKALTGEPMVAIEPAQEFPFDDERWEFNAAQAEVVEHLGQQALFLQGGVAILPDLEMQNGMIEFDVAVSGQRGFAGLMFRLQDTDNFEHFYIRPHQSGNPDANQYTPVFNGVSAWQLYHGTGYGVPVEYPTDQWMHVKIVFAGSKAEVYINSDKPVLRVHDLKREVMSGRVGVNVANFSPAHFANFKVSVLADAYELPHRLIDDEQPSAGLVTSWLVSDAFDGSLLAGFSKLGRKVRGDRTWTELWTERNGLANLARIQGLSQGRETVFASMVLTSDKAQLKEMSFGYSDAASIYLNGTLIYRGSNAYQSRDYRYLGTIGLFDSVTLSLEEGENEVWLAISEAFGGWGVMAEIPDRDGLTMREARR